MKENPKYLSDVLERLNLIYELTQGVGFTESWKQFNNRMLDEIVAELVKRGILLKTKFFKEESRGVHYHFKWVASMAPNKTLAKSVATTIRTERKQRDDARKQAQETMKASFVKEEQKAESPGEYIELAEQPEQKPIQFEMQKSYSELLPLSAYSSQDLWNELKLRGYQAEGNRLVLITKKYLD